ESALDFRWLHLQRRCRQAQPIEQARVAQQRPIALLLHRADDFRHPALDAVLAAAAPAENFFQQRLKTGVAGLDQTNPHARAVPSIDQCQLFARTSLAITGAPDNSRTPRTIARLPSSLICAPMRSSSWACMKRFSKIVSVITLTPSATAISTINCACRSVGK